MTNPALLCLDLGTATGWALLNEYGSVVSGTAHFKPRRFEGGGMRYLRFKRWLTETKNVSGRINAVYFEEGYFNVMPDIVRTEIEILQQEKPPLRLRALPDAISRLEQTFEWMAWLEVEERKLVWKRAANVRWKSICWELGCDRSTAWRRWVIALTKVSVHLNSRKD